MKIRSCIIKLSLIPGCLSCFTQVNAQSYYPGGIGNINLVVWLNANKFGSITQNGANQVSAWADLSGNGYNFVQATAGHMPVYGAAASPAGSPALTFTSTSSQYLSTPNLPATSFTGGISAFAVASYNAPQTTQGWQRIFDFGNGTASNNFMMGRDGSTANAYYEGWNGGSGDQTYTTSAPIINVSENLYEVVQQGGTAGALSAVAHYLAGAAQAATGQTGSSRTYVPANITRTSNYIGRSNWTADNYFSGTMSEVLIYNTAFSTTERVILENYAAAEWNQTVSVSEYTPPSITTYTTNLVGIGYTSAADNFLTDVAGSTDGLGFSSTTSSFLSTAGYVMAAHNGQANTVITNATVPGIISATSLTRWNRSWDVQTTGGNSAGTITLNFNFSDYNGTTPTSSNTFALLYNAMDGTFATGANELVTTTSTMAAGNIVSFNVTAPNLANGYYTILYSTSPIVLPLSLTAFTATRQSSGCLLAWSISIEAGDDSFDIERGTDGSDFVTIGMIAAKGDSTMPGYYTFIDNKPATGVNTYRLKITGQNGITSYSGIREVDFGTEPALSIYPNPMTDKVNIAVSPSSGIIDIRVVNIQGQVVRELTGVSAGNVTIPVNSLARGIYFIEVGTRTATYVRKLLKF